MPEIRVRGLRLRAGWAALAPFVLLAVFGGFRTALFAVSALALHEAAHIAAMRMLGVKTLSVELMPFGGVIDAEDWEDMPPAKQGMAALSGVLFSFLMYFASRSVSPGFARANLAIALFNSLPAPPLDGGRVASALLSLIFDARHVNRALSVLTMALGLALSALSVYAAYRGAVSPYTALLGAYLLYAAARGYASRAALITARSLRTREKLRRGGVLRVNVRACAPDMPKRELIKALAPGRYLITHIIDPLDGRLIRTYDEPELIAMMLGDVSKDNG